MTPFQSRKSDTPYGLVVVTPSGKVLAEYPRMPGRADAKVDDQASFMHFLREKSDQVMLGVPSLGKFSGKPMLPMGVMLRDAHGEVQALLVGISALNEVHFLDAVREGQIGKSGSFLLVSPKESLFVAASKPAMVMTPTPKPGVNLLHDRAMAGFRGSDVTVNAFGEEELSSIATVPSTGWFVVARMPTAEAFYAISHLQQVLLKNTLWAILLVVILLGVIVRRTLLPLAQAATQADQMTHGQRPLTPLPVVYNDEVGHLTQAFNRLLEKLRQQQLRLDHLAHHDELTGLPNRPMLFEQLRQSLARADRMNTQLALLYLDLDGFKPINDELGHAQGDRVLVEFTRRISGIIRETDTFARIGGDEFVLLISDLGDEAFQIANTLAQKCIEAMQAPFLFSEIERHVGVSIGVSIGDRQQTPDSLLQLADQAMYNAKKSGKGRYCVIEQGLTLSA